MKCFKTCVIIYGFLSHEQLSSFNDHIPVILIEPRKQVIDGLKQNMPSHVKLLPKLLSHQNTLQERSLYKVDDSFFTEYPTQRQSKSKQRCFTTSIQNIVRQFKIQNIKALICNINVDNLDECISNASCFNHIISHICITSTCSFFHIDNSFVETLFTQIEKGPSYLLCLDDSYSIFEHKNLYVPLPKICLYITEDIPIEEQDNFDLLIAQYNITLLETPKQAIEKTVLKGSDSTLIKNNAIQDFDIVIQFNPKYLSYKDFFQILYPIKDNVIYSNKEFDILYGTKNCMYMLCQIIESKYFTDYLDNLKKTKKVTYKLFYKKHFHDYIAKIFDIKLI